MKELIDMFSKQLDVDEEIGLILVQEGFSTIEEVAYVPASELIEIEEFDEDIVEELRSRARDVLLTQAIVQEEKIDEVEPAEDLLSLEGMDKGLAFTLASKGVVTREDLAELATDDLLEISEMDEEVAAALIMKARAHWFEEEQQA
jgi:N utilization substance protein A